MTIALHQILTHPDNAESYLSSYKQTMGWFREVATLSMENSIARDTAVQIFNIYLLHHFKACSCSSLEITISHIAIVCYGLAYNLHGIGQLHLHAFLSRFLEVDSMSDEALNVLENQISVFALPYVDIASTPSYLMRHLLPNISDTNIFYAYVDDIIAEGYQSTAYTITFILNFIVTR